MWECTWQYQVLLYAHNAVATISTTQHRTVAPHFRVIIVSHDGKLSCTSLEKVGADGVNEVITWEFIKYRQVARLNELREFLAKELYGLSVNPDAAMRLWTPLQDWRQRVNCQRLSNYVLTSCTEQQITSSPSSSSSSLFYFIITLQTAHCHTLHALSVSMSKVPGSQTAGFCILLLNSYLFNK